MKSSAAACGTDGDLTLVRMFKAYRKGLLRQSRPASFKPVRDLEKLLFLGTLGWSSIEARLQLRHLRTACGYGLEAARQGLVEDSSVYFKQAQKPLDKLHGTARLAWLLGTSIYQSGFAYLEFRRGRLGHAVECLDLVMDADLELEQTGLSVMQIHRIQQGQNLARMKLRLAQRKEAMELAGRLLAYIEGQSGELPYHHEWHPKSLRAVPRNLLRGMIHQIVGEISSFIVTGQASKEEWLCLINYSKLVKNPDVAIFPQIQYGLLAQAARLKGDMEGYLRYLECFFRRGIRRCHMLWYALTAELVESCREIETQLSRQIGEVILRDSTKWKSVPLPVLELFQSAKIERQVA